MLRAKPDPEWMTNAAGEASPGILRHRHGALSDFNHYGVHPSIMFVLNLPCPVLTIRTGAIALAPNPSSLWEGELTVFWGEVHRPG